MTRVWSEGFEMGDAIGYTTYSQFGNSGIRSTQKRTGTYSYYLNENAHFLHSISAVSEFYLRVGIYQNDLNDYHYIYWRSGANNIGYIRIQNSIYINCNGLTATGSSIITAGSWFLLEIHVKIDNSTGVVEVLYEGVPECNVSGDTLVGAYSSADNIYFPNYPSPNTAWYIDDIGLNDTAGAVDNSWCGDGHITVIMPDDDSTPLQLTPSAAVHHHLLVDEVPADGDTTYVEGSVTDEEDIYGLAACGLGDVIITRIWTEARAEDTSSSGLKVALITKASGGSEVSGGDVVLTGTYATKVLGAEQRVNPVDSAAWEVADIDALEGGVRTRN